MAQNIKVTACLITWKRQHNLGKIVDSLIKYPFISEIIIRDNSKEENIINYGRYTSALKAQNDFIYTQDDDCIVDNIEIAYEKFLEQPDRVSHCGTEGYRDVISQNLYGDAQMAMFGWGAFFDRDLIPVLDKYVAKYGKDMCFYRETDRIFSMLLNKHHNFTLANVTHLDNELGALSSQPDHITYKNMAINRCLELLK